VQRTAHTALTGLRCYQALDVLHDICQQQHVSSADLGCWQRTRFNKLEHGVAMHIHQLPGFRDRQS